MQTVRITPADGSPRQGVIVFAAGWAGSDELVRHLTVPEGYDLFCLFDYRTLPVAVQRSELHTWLKAYPERHLVAWSFGVWAADTVFGSEPFAGDKEFWETATAINGTPIPIHDRYGIPARAFAVTERSIAAAGTTRFLERMCGTREILNAYYRHRSTRPLEEVVEELTLLGQQAAGTPMEKRAGVRWTQAVVGGADLIFPPANMTAWWQMTGVPTIHCAEMPHYPLAEADILSRLIHEAR